MQVSNAMDPSEWMKQKQQRPVRRSLYGALRKEANVKCLILTALIYGCIVAIIWCRVTTTTKVDIDFTAFPITSTREISPCDDGSIYIPTAFVVMLYLLYLVECWHCKAWHQLKFEKTDLNSAYQKIHEVRQAQPVVWWKAVCYHYVRRTREITRYRNGNAYTCSQVYYERVNSHVAAGCFFFALCGMKDVSRELIDLEKHAATKIQLSKGFLFANLATAREFQEQRAAFFQEQERYDDYMEMREGMDLSNVHFKESLISWASPDNPPWFSKVPVFWLCNFLLLSWPLRLILELNTAHVHYQVNKLFGVNYMSPSGSELLLSAPRSHGLPINNHQYRIHNRAISSHHSRLNGHPYSASSRRRRSVVAASERLDQEETAPLLLNSNSTNPHQDSQSHHQLVGKSEKDELHDGSFKNLNKDQQNSSLNNNNDSGSTNANNNTSPSSSSGRIFFPQWRSSFFSRNFRFTRQTGYKLTRSVTLLMTKPERLEFLASTQHQFPDEFGYYGDSDEGARLLHDETYYPSCSSPPPPPFLTPSPEEDEEEAGDQQRTGHTYVPTNDNERSRLTSSTSTTTFNHHHDRNHNPSHHHHTSLVMTGRDQAGNNDSTNCLAPSYSQALLSMEPSERSSVIAYFRNESSNPSTSSTSTVPPPAGNPNYSSPSPVLDPNFTNEHHQENLPRGFMNVNGVCNDSLVNNNNNNNSGTMLGIDNVTSSPSMPHEPSNSGQSITPSPGYNIPSSTSLDNFPTGTTENPTSNPLGNNTTSNTNDSTSSPLPAHVHAPQDNDVEDDLCISQENSSQPLLSNRHAHPSQRQLSEDHQQHNHQHRQPCSSSSSMSSVTGHYQRASTRLANAGSSMVLNTMAPREMTGVQIDLTQPIVITVPRDPLRESAAGMVGSSSSSSTRRTTNIHHHQHLPHPSFSGNGDDQPPTYFEALRTSRPVFLPTLARIRRCFTERDIASRFSSKKSHWLDEIADMERARSNHHHQQQQHHHQSSPSSSQPHQGASSNGNGEEECAGESSTSQV